MNRVRLQSRDILIAWFAFATTVLFAACNSTPPSMVDRMPPSVPRYAEESELSRPDLDLTGNRRHLVVRAVIESQERFRAGTEFDAYVPHEPFNWLVTLRIEQVVTGTYDAETIRIVIRSPFEQFAFPFSEHREFRLTLAPNSRGDEHVLVDIAPKGAHLIEQQRKILEAEQAADAALEEAGADSN